MGAADCGYMVSTKKPAKKWILRGLKLRGLTLAQEIWPKLLYPRNRNSPLSHFQFFEIRKSLAGKSYGDFKPRNSTYQ